MKRLLSALVLLALPSLALAAPQSITIVRNSGFWRFASASPPVLDWGGNPLPENSSIVSTSARVSAVLRDLAATNVPEYTCRARVFYVGFENFYTIGVTSLNPKSCVPTNQ